MSKISAKVSKVVWAGNIDPRYEMFTAFFQVTDAVTKSYMSCRMLIAVNDQKAARIIANGILANASDFIPTELNDDQFDVFANAIRWFGIKEFNETPCSCPVDWGTLPTNPYGGESEEETLSSEEEYMVAEAVAEAYNQPDVIMNSYWMEGDGEYMEAVASGVLGREVELSHESLSGIWEAAYELWTNDLALGLAADAEKEIDDILSGIDLCGKTSYNYWVALEKADAGNIEAFRNNLACLESAKARFEKYYDDLGNALGCSVGPDDGFQLSFGQDLAGMVEKDDYGWYNFDDLASEYEDAIYRIESELAA